MSSRPTTSIAWIAGYVLLLSLAAYVGAYYVMVNPIAVYRRPSLVLPAYGLSRDKAIMAVETSNSMERRFRKIFTPIHWLDRHVRRFVWESRP
ncbi:MAG: hypothetical protein IT428_32255 [Planctomycetaceae bacterium]|nr:hypothetical protein [Planctomycetaceae bacterium]